MDLGLAAAVMTLHRDGDDHRYDGWVGLSALPAAPVVDERLRRRQWRTLGRRVSAAPRRAGYRSTAPAHA
jgi:hypothetical protein